MLSQETFYRPPEIQRESRTLPAIVYNLARVLLCRSDQQVVFVPIRSMLFQAVIDKEEIIFLDAAVSQRNIVLAWQHFTVRGRNGLNAAVPYEAVYYQKDAFGIMPRLQGEFTKALEMLKQKQAPPVGTSAAVIPLKR